MTQAEAIARYTKYNTLDPFPSIPPAFLNSSDVHDYIKTIGMVWPFDESQLNGVTLTLCVGDLAIYWNEKNEKIRTDIKEAREFRLKSNSIAFIQILEELRLPAYIIVRFNLRVTITYRGLLLGTGPIVDPGFAGKINIPIHNLTNNEYVFRHGEPLIEMEFTKISPNNQWANNATSQQEPPRIEGYKNWKPNSDKIKTEKRDLDYYLSRANQGNSIQSSIPPVVYKMEEAIKVAEDHADKVDGNIDKLSNKVDGNIDKISNRVWGINIFIMVSFLALLGVVATIASIFKSDIRNFRNQQWEVRYVNLQSQHRDDTSSYNLQIRQLQEQRRQDSLLIDQIKKKLKL
jgi:deoxycytidine triphosphate deaminase